MIVLNPRDLARPSLNAGGQRGYAVPTCSEKQGRKAYLTRRVSQNDFAGVEFRKIANEWLFFAARRKKSGGSSSLHIALKWSRIQNYVNKSGRYLAVREPLCHFRQ